jgi:long-chain fatty acid transport protein
MSKIYKLVILALMAFLAMETVYAGGIVTNTNQSAAYCRMLVRDASTEADAVYYNPAGLTALPDGLFFSLSNQSIFQTRTITNSYTYLNTDKFEGTASAPLFPGVYAGYKISDFVVSVGFNPVGGGGSAEYDKGVPSFQIPIADLVPGFGGPQNASYSTDINFEGTSVYYGVQGGLSYKISDMISIFAGARYNMAQNTYSGYLRNTNLTLLAYPQPYDGRADVLLQGIAAQYGAAKEQFATAGLLDSAAKYGKLEAETNIKATLLGDQEADVEQTGNGITPIIGANFIFMDNKLNIGFKYELNTPLKIKNNTTKDLNIGFDEAAMEYVTQFPDGAEYNMDIPALLSIGAAYKLTDDFSCMAGFHYYFEKNANWDGLQDNLDGNSLEFGIGLEYTLTKDILLSAGYLLAKSGAGEKYQSDLSYDLSSNSVAFGGKYKLMDNLELNLGFIYVMYEDSKKDTNHDIGGSGMLVPANYTFGQTTTIFAIGFDYILGSK